MIPFVAGQLTTGEGHHRERDIEIQGEEKRIWGERVQGLTMVTSNAFLTVLSCLSQITTSREQLHTD